MRPLALHIPGLAVLLGGILACGDGPGPNGSSSVRVDLGEVPVGGRSERTVVAGVWRDGSTLLGVPPALDVQLLRRRDERLVSLVWSPRRLGPLDATLEIRDSGTDTTFLEIEGSARPPSIDVVPEIVDLGVVIAGDPSWAPLWVWSETGRPVAFGGVPVCGNAALCIRSADGRLEPGDAAGGQRGLPQALSVRAEPTRAGLLGGTVVLRGCDEPECAVEVSVRGRAIDDGAACTPSVVSFGALASDSLAERRVTCTGVDLGQASWDLDGLEIVDSSTDSAVLRFHAPRAPGVVHGHLEVGDVSVPLLAQVVDAASCVLDYGPTPLVFGAVPVGTEGEQRLSFLQRAELPCLLGEAVVTPGSPFSLPPPGVPAHWIEPGVVDRLPVRFHPVRSGPQAGTLTTYGPDRIDVRLEGIAVDGAAEVRPRTVDFGVVSSCAGRTRQLLVENVGDGPLRLEGTTITGRDPTAFALTGQVPDSIGPGQVRILSPRIAAAASGTVSADLALSFETPAPVEIRVGLSAVVTDDLQEVDEFNQLESPSVDILLVVDPDLGNAAPIVRQNLAAFGSFVEAQEIWARVAMITTEIGSPLLGPTGHEILTSTDASDLGEELSNRIAVSGAATPSEGLGAALQALTSTGGAAARILRPNAFLSVVVISPREDQSAGAPGDFVSGFFGIKGFRNTNRFSFNAVVGVPPDGCTVGGVTAEPAQRYVDVASRTGGIVEPFCTVDFSTALENLGVAVFGFKTRFFLTKRPIPETIEVEVEGEAVPSLDADGVVLWTYDTATNSVSFSPFGVPPPGAHFVVRYLVRCL